MSNKSIGSIKDYTPKYKLIIPRFDKATWHDFIEANFRSIDALLYNMFGINNFVGQWTQITTYTAGQVVFVGEDKDINGNDTEYTGRLIKVLQDHTTDNSDYFNIFYNLHPEYYELFGDASTAQIYANLSKDWANKLDGTIITPQGIDTGEYSSKKYAQDAKNSSDITNTYKEEAKNYATNAQNSSILSQNQATIATNSANSAQNSQTSAQNSANLAKTYADSALNDANNSKNSAELSKQYANDKINQTHITNCITEIPQDIKLELSNGTLTLKAGSKVYVPYGPTAYNLVTVTSDISKTATHKGTFMVIKSDKNAIYLADIRGCLSGTLENQPTTLDSASGLYYATDQNAIWLTGNSGADWYASEDYSFPIAIITVSNGAISSIDQVFNGFGYIGGTRFILPNVKGLAPDGRNEDGSLKNYEWTVDKVNVYSWTPKSGKSTINITYGQGTNNYGPYYEQEEEPTTSGIWYNPKENIMRLSTDNGETWKVIKQTLVCVYDTSIGGISNFNPKLPFKAVDYNDFADELNTKANKSDVVDLTSDQKIDGVKQYIDTLTITNENDSLGEIPSVETAKSLSFSDFAGRRLGSVMLKTRENGDRSIELNVNSTKGTGVSTPLKLISAYDGDVYATAPASSQSGSVLITSVISRNSDGYVKLGNGMIIQWGTTTTSNATRATTTITFPVAFSNTNYKVVPVCFNQANPGERFYQIHTKTTTNFIAQTTYSGTNTGTTICEWIAIGY